LTILFAFLASKDCYIIWFSNIMIISEPDEGYHASVELVLDMKVIAEARRVH
jgi:hypothetical protein